MEGKTTKALRAEQSDQTAIQEDNCWQSIIRPFAFGHCEIPLNLQLSYTNPALHITTLSSNPFYPDLPSADVAARPHHGHHQQPVLRLIILVHPQEAIGLDRLLPLSFPKPFRRVLILIAPTDEHSGQGIQEMLHGVCGETFGTGEVLWEV